ncbi:hypothetical protein RJ639_018787 [Escallonia herrerae]|uniref:Uncharacterized protein n=1 Tax=Escallonia herrerae TaxID=1293975 RepID=A0AA89AKD8_9ASTE|nr:hypothetical protein RJ639_018787 [Escallonia herrerae]
MKKVSCVLALGTTAMLLLCQVSVPKAVTCTVVELASCTSAFTSPTLSSSKECCKATIEELTEKNETYAKAVEDLRKKISIDSIRMCDLNSSIASNLRSFFNSSIASILIASILFII